MWQQLVGVKGLVEQLGYQHILVVLQRGGVWGPSTGKNYWTKLEVRELFHPIPVPNCALLGP